MRLLLLRRTFLLAMAATLLPIAAAPRALAQPSFDHAGLARRALEQHIRPAYRRLAQSSAALEQATGDFCKVSDAPHRKALNVAFDNVVTAWGHIEHITFGPIAVESRAERILFFPDRRGLGARQIAAALQSQDKSVTEVESLSRKSVALQGLGAFEVVMLGGVDRAETAQARQHRCRFGHAIAGNIATIARSVSGEWQQPDGFARSWLEPGAGNSAFLKSMETTLALAKAIGRGIEQVRDERTIGPLGFGPQRRKLPVVMRVSGRTMRLVQANIDGIRDMWTTGGLEAAIISARAPAPTDSVPEIAALVAGELATASRLAGSLLGQPAALDGGKATRTIVSMGFPLKNARYHAMALFTEVAGVTLGFNASDGD